MAGNKILRGILNFTATALVLFFGLGGLEHKDADGYTSVRNTQQVNAAGNIVFWKEEDEVITMMGANYYNNGQKKTRTILAHSNVGYTVWDYLLDSAGNEIAVYAYARLSSGNQDYFNSYLHIQQYNSARELENDPAVLKMIADNKKYLLFRRTYDTGGNEIEIIAFEENGDTSGIEIKIYDGNHNLIKETFNGMGKGDYYYTYDSNNNQLSSTCITHTGLTTEVRLYKYDENNHLIEEQHLDQGRLQYTEKNSYKNNKLIRQITYAPNNKKTSESTFEYDEQGNITMRTDINAKNKKTIHTWKYE